MKKTLFSLLLLLCSASSFADTRQVVLLLHGGTGQTFAPDQLQEAVNAAVAGDTLCLNDGVYPLGGDTLTIDKPISIVGTGINTKLQGTVNISIPDSVTLTARMLDALRVTGNVCVQKPVNGLKYRKCQFDASLIWNATTRDAQMDRCYIENFNTSINLKSANVVNCKIAREHICSDNKGNMVSFINCALREILIYVGNTSLGHQVGYSYSTYMNCIIFKIDDQGSSLYTMGKSQISNSSYYYSLFLILSSYYKEMITIMDNCYEINNYTKDWTQDNGTKWSKEEMIAKGCLGNDGTVVGPEGGGAPYSLIPTGIKVRESKLTIDGENRTLNVKIKLTTN